MNCPCCGQAVKPETFKQLAAVATHPAGEHLSEEDLVLVSQLEGMARRIAMTPAQAEDASVVAQAAARLGRLVAQLGELLTAVEPFTVDGGVGCGREEADNLAETYQRLTADPARTQPEHTCECCGKPRGAILCESCQSASDRPEQGGDDA